MGRPAMRINQVVTTLLAASLLVTMAPSARAQGSTKARLVLDSQTPWATLQNPLIQIRIRAENLSAAPFENLSLGIALGDPVRTRTTYDTALRSGPAFPLFAVTQSEQGSLAPGAERTFDLQLDLLAAGASQTESLIYPLRIDLRTGEQPTGAVLRTPVPFLVRRPVRPLEMSWTTEIAPPPAIGPDGKLVDESLPGLLEPGGSIRAEVDALGVLASKRRPSPADVAISPRFLEELKLMSDGFQEEGGASVPPGEGAAADAAVVLHTLEVVVHSGVLEVSALPYTAPNLPALLGSRLEHDLASQLVLGNRTFEQVLGTQPSTAAFRPPDGALDQAALDELSSGGGEILLGDSAWASRPENPNGLTLTPTTLLAATGHAVPAVLPDPDIQGLLASDVAADPVLAAQDILGELAAVWQEAPSPGYRRGVSMSTSGLQLPVGFWGAFAQRVVTAPFLQPVTAAKLVHDVPPVAASTSLLAEGSGSFSRGYVEGIRGERHRIDAMRSMLADPGDLPERLDTMLLVAESGAFVGNELSGQRWIDGVNGTTEGLFEAARPPNDQIFTLPSTSGTIPIRLGDPGDRTLHVLIELSSSRLRFPSGDTRAVTLNRPNQIVFFPVQTITTGRVTVEILVLAPSGFVVDRANLIVQSTAYNQIALAVTFGAALLLVGLWVRRLFRRRAS